MKYTNKRNSYNYGYSYRRKRRNRKLQLTLRLVGFFTILTVLAITIILALQPRNFVSTFEKKTYGDSISQSEMFANDLCVTDKDVRFEAFRTKDEFHGALLFDIKNRDVLYSERVHEKLYPASTTKILTAYVALKYGDLTDTVTVSKNAVDIPSDSSSAYLKAGDRLTLKDTLYALMLPSGNDSAIAIAEHVSGSVEDFAKLMNQEAKKLGATNTHFVNPHGYQSKEHYTTAYDLYLIFNECIKNETFLDIISATSRSTVVTEKNGNQRSVTWNQSNQFINGGRSVPKGIDVIGGKTGTTFDAGACIVLYVKDANETPYISIIMGASSRRNLYDNMTFLLAAIPD